MNIFRTAGKAVLFASGFYFTYLSALPARAAECPANSFDEQSPSYGAICAIQPSRTDPNIQDTGPGNAGFGYHVIGIPSDPSKIKGVLLYLQGTSGSPYDAVSHNFSTGPILSEGVEANYLVIALAYANPVEVGVLCSNDSACYGDVRQEIVYGVNTSPLVDVDSANGIMHRLDALISFIKANSDPKFPYPPGISGKNVDWSHVRLGGGSQGGGHAGYIARDLASERVCFLSSPVDAVGVFDKGISTTVSAAWLTEKPWQTATNRLKGVVHVKDDGYEQIVTNFGSLGMVQSTSETVPNHDWVAITIPESDPHSSPAQDPNLAYARDWSCLSDTDVVPAPTISGIRPSSGPVGTLVAVNGTSLSSTRTVLVGGLSVPFTAVSDEQIIVTINSPANKGPISVTTYSGTVASATGFNVTAGINSLSPTGGAVGTNVTLQGFGFSGATAVKFNGVSVPFKLLSDTQLSATINSGTNAGTPTVSVPTGTIYSPLTFTVTPTITSFSPQSGPVGAAVTITGSGFTGTSTVDFSNIDAQFTQTSDTQIQAVVPEGASNNKIKVTTVGGADTSSDLFNVQSVPQITDFSPTAGGVGDNVTINGSDLDGTTTVKFNGVAATPNSVTAATVRVSVPAGATTGKITVVNAAGSDVSSGSFQVFSEPVVSGFSPDSGSAGTQVKISGSHFNGTTDVSIGGVDASFTVNSDTQITATVGRDAHTSTIRVTNPAGTGASADLFQVN